MEETMKKLTLALFAAACAGLAAPAFAADRVSAEQGDRQVLSAQTGKAVAQYAGMKEQYAQSKKKGSKKKQMTKRSSWGG